MSLFQQVIFKKEACNYMVFEGKEDKDSFAKLIKEKGIYEYYSQVNYFRLSPPIIKKDIIIDKTILDKIRIIKSSRVVLIDLGT